jgi:tetratricopeptide (TPR) repeat protein
MRTLTVTITITLALALALATRAHADDADDKTKTDKAEALFKGGKRHFDIGDYTAAITEWKESYLLSGAPLILYNIGQAYRLAGNCAQANRFYLTYKRAVVKPDKDLDKNMAKCAGVEPATGDEKPAEVKPAEAKPEETKPAETKPAETKPAETKPAETKPAETRPPQPASSPGHSLRVAGVVLASVGAAFEIVALLEALKASSESNSVQQQKGVAWSMTLMNHQIAGQNAENAGRVLAAVGGGVAVTGLVMWYVGHRKGGHVEVSLAPGAASVGYACAW